MTNKKEQISPGFSQGTRSLFEYLRLTAKPGNKVIFPRQWKASGTRVRGNNSIHTWFVNEVDSMNVPKTPGISKTALFRVEENLAVFLVANVDLKGIINQLKCHTLVVFNANLDDYYSDPSIQVQYYRLDFHPDALGKLFREPLPHLHIGGEDEPRIFLRNSRPELVLTEFIEFLYLNYFYDQWETWAKDICLTECIKHSRECYFDRLSTAYKISDVPTLIAQNKQLRELDQALQSVKMSMFSVPMGSFEYNILNYPKF